MPGRILNRNVGGNTTYAAALADGLGRRGVTVDTLRCFSHPALTMMSETISGLKRADGQIIHYVADTGPLVRTRTSSVVTVHGVASRWITGVRTANQERIWRNRVRRAIDSTDALITVSSSSAADIADIFDIAMDKISVIPHGIDLNKFSRKTTVSDSVQSKIPENYLLYIGNIEPRKNIEELVKAMAHPSIRALRLPLVIAGKPAWNYDKSMAAITTSPDVIYLGFVSDADRTALMQQCKLFIFPSRYEGFGFPVLEAMAAGAPVLTTDRGALRDISGPSKVLDGCDSEAIADGIEDALIDDDWRMVVVQDGRQWSSSYTWDASLDAHISVYNAVGRK